MKCEKCGTELVKNGTYCVRCGTMVKSEQERLINLAKSELAGEDSSKYSNLTNQHNPVENTPATPVQQQVPVQPQVQQVVQPQMQPQQVVNPQPSVQPQEVPQPQVVQPQQPQTAPQQVAVPMPNIPVQPVQQVVQPTQATVQPQPQMNVQPQMQPQPQVQPQVMTQPVNSAVTTPTVNPQVTNNIPEQPTNTININMDTDEFLLRAYIGDNYKKIAKNPFNFAAFFFEAFYMFYRKLYVYAIIFMTINIIILRIFADYYTYANTLLGLISGFIVNKLYINHAKKEIEKIKSENPQMSTLELSELCKENGGTSIPNIFTGLIANIILSIVIGYLLSLVGIESKNTWEFNIDNEDEPIINEKDEDNSSYNDEDESDGDNNTYVGILSTDSSVTILDEFNITIPSIFEEGIFNDEDTLNYEYEGEEGIFNECSITLNAVSGYSSSKSLINQMQDYNEDNDASKVKETKINGITWNWFSYDNAFGETYIYGTTKDGKVYLLEYEIQEDADDSCYSHREKILKSIKKK